LSQSRASSKVFSMTLLASIQHDHDRNKHIIQTRKGKLVIQNISINLNNYRYTSFNI